MKNKTFAEILEKEKSKMEKPKKWYPLGVQVVHHTKKKYKRNKKIDME